MNLKNLPFNWVDLLVVGILVLGILRGRKRGMSSELLDVIQWGIILVAGAMLYKPVGQWFAGFAVFSRLFCYIATYVLIGALIMMLFGGIKQSIGGRIIESNIFGNAEYYLGMVAGMIRFAMIILAAMALLNAKYISDKEGQAQEKEQREIYGSTFFPTLYGMQQTVFRKSFTGQLVKDHMSFFLIKPSQVERRQFQQRELMTF